MCGSTTRAEALSKTRIPPSGRKIDQTTGFSQCIKTTQRRSVLLTAKHISRRWQTPVEQIPRSHGPPLKTFTTHTPQRHQWESRVRPQLTADPFVRACDRLCVCVHDCLQAKILAKQQRQESMVQARIRAGLKGEFDPENGDNNDEREGVCRCASPAKHASRQHSKRVHMPSLHPTLFTVHDFWGVCANLRLGSANGNGHFRFQIVCLRLLTSRKRGVCTFLRNRVSVNWASGCEPLVPKPAKAALGVNFHGRS